MRNYYLIHTQLLYCTTRCNSYIVQPENFKHIIEEKAGTKVMEEMEKNKRKDIQ